MAPLLWDFGCRCEFRARRYSRPPCDGCDAHPINAMPPRKFIGVGAYFEACLGCEEDFSMESWVEPLALVFVALRTAGLYLGLLVAMRIVGKRKVGQMAPSDIIVLLLIGDAAQNAM